MKNKISILLIPVLVTVLMVITVKYIDQKNEIEKLSNSISNEHLKQELNDLTETFINLLYKGEHTQLFSKNAEKRYSSYDNESVFNSDEGYPNFTDKEVEFYVINTTLEDKKFYSKGVYTITTRDDNGYLYSKLLLFVKIEWVYEDKEYKVEDFEITFLDSQYDSQFGESQ